MKKSIPTLIGDTFEHAGNTYIVEEATDQCVGCSLYQRCTVDSSEFGFQCIGYRRPDKKDVIAKLKK